MQYSPIPTKSAHSVPQVPAHFTTGEERVAHRSHPTYAPFQGAVAATSECCRSPSPSPHAAEGASDSCEVALWLWLWHRHEVVRVHPPAVIMCHTFATVGSHSSQRRSGALSACGTLAGLSSGSLSTRAGDLRHDALEARWAQVDDAEVGSSRSLALGTRYALGSACTWSIYNICCCSPPVLRPRVRCLQRACVL